MAASESLSASLAWAITGRKPLAMGIEFTGTGMKIRAALPLESYRFDSPLVGVVKTRRGYEGWDAPSRSGQWTVEISLPEEAAKAVSWVEVDGRRTPARRQATGAIVAAGSNTPNKPLR
jgi:hypothetical protein